MSILGGSVNLDKMPEEGEKIKGKRSAKSFCAMDNRSCTFPIFGVEQGKWVDFLEVTAQA